MPVWSRSMDAGLSNQRPECNSRYGRRNKMSYEIYKKKLSVEEYFSIWDDERFKLLTKELAKDIYTKYLVKCDVFQRDNFQCQSINCTNPSEKLTMHHVKFQKNGGENKVKNCVTLCLDCHKRFHSGKYDLTLKNSLSLPSHMRGKTFKLDKGNEINWKAVKKQMKQFRKKLHNESGLKISWEQVAFLMKWLEIVYDEDLND